jgi:3'-phosphoadenosine 5'-phosphosulfate sulfotransferase (PAPS reductase)/FAD synthetase
MAEESGGSPMTIEQLAESSPNLEILNSWLVTDNKLKRCRKALVAISGGSDSDMVLHLCATLDTNGKATYVFYDTGLEFQATKDHIKRLEEKYGIEIEVKKAVKPIPTCCREYGVPFLSKRVSDYISRLQKHDFKWEDRPFEELIKEYPSCKGALMWWCNTSGEGSRFNISRNKWLKEFMVANPPKFKISDKCCHYAKKLVAKRCIEDGDFDLNITGVRKAEGGNRATAYKNCFTPATETTIDQYRPVFWYTKDTKTAFEETYGIKHSDCYEKWGLPRTGCSGCPFGRNLEAELAACEKYEPKMYKALNNVFGASYEYTRQYREFQRKMRGEMTDE